MMDWLLDTIVWTAVLIALVLLVRRPVARWFGPQVAYALWTLPIIRLVLPPIELPAWMAPAESAPVELTAGPIPAEALAVVTTQQALAASEAPSLLASLPLTEITLFAWLAGATVFLVLRFRGYHAMKREMLEDACEVGRAGKVRLVESPATSAPLAFGVREKVVALPVGFMASHNRLERDLALAHEIAHHDGHDLLVNFLAQPLFAIHWFNPLGRIGWLAMRRDQEAACDARVIVNRNAAERATYAKLIANFAAGPNAALAAPMACPVLGDKSIIQRLRSLKMNKPSARRRLAGRGMLAAALVALPLTASISYAASDAPVPPAPPSAPAAPSAPNAPVPPSAPETPLPPLAPAALQASAEAVEDEDVVVVREVEVDEDGNRREVEKRRKVIVHEKHGKMSKEERKEMMRELREELKDMDVEIEEAMAEARVAMLELKDGQHGITKVSVTCKDGSEGTELRMGDGQSVTRLCTSEVMAQALNGLKQARKAIASDQEMDAEMRSEVLRALDEKISNWQNKDG